MKDYNERKELRKERLKAGIEKSKKEIESLNKRGNDISRFIPLGQPILIGHHSEKRHRRDIEKLNNYTKKRIEEYNKVEYYENKINSIENNNVISSDDPDAIIKLKEKLSKLEKLQEALKERNKQARKNKTEKVPAYELSNNNQNMNSIKKRIALLESKQNDLTKTILEKDGLKIIDNVEENRLQIIFDEKPAEEIRTKLKQNGFKYSYTNNAWQRFRSSSAVYTAKKLFE
jgi:frataxin-like iron-binding protein CyaY